MSRLRILDPRRPGYAETAAASVLPLDSELWPAYMRVAEVPLWALQAVQATVRQNVWKRAGDPLKTIREAGLRKAERMGLKDLGVDVDLACNGDQE
jgi:hypothetical protein